MNAVVILQVCNEYLIVCVLCVDMSVLLASDPDR